jgi:hypothetical protein
LEELKNLVRDVSGRIQSDYLGMEAEGIPYLFYNGETVALDDYDRPITAQRVSKVLITSGAALGISKTEVFAFLDEKAFGDKLEELIKIELGFPLDTDLTPAQGIELANRERLFNLGCDADGVRVDKAPTADELNKLVHKISHRVARSLKRQGLLQQDAENSYLELDTDEQPMDQLIGNSITYRIAIGPNQGHKVFTLQMLPPQPDEPSTARVAKIAGFSLHAGVMAEAHQRDKLGRLCRYISRPAVSEKRLSLTSMSLTSSGLIRYQLKTPYRNGTTHVIFEPLDFIAKLAALVPKPRVNLTRFHGVFAPRNKLRDKVTPGKRKRNKNALNQQSSQSPAERRASMTSAQRLKRVFNIDIETCNQCGGSVKVIACIEDPEVIRKILDHLAGEGSKEKQADAPECRAPPQYDLVY